MNFIAFSSLEKLLRSAAPSRCRGSYRGPGSFDTSIGHRVHVLSTRYTRWLARGGRHMGPGTRLELECGLCGKASTLEGSHAPIGVGAKLGREGIQGVECAPDHGTIGGRLRSQESEPRHCDVEDA